MDFIDLAEKRSQAILEARVAEIGINSIEERLSRLGAGDEEEAGRARAKLNHLQRELAEKQHLIRMADAEIEWFKMELAAEQYETPSKTLEAPHDTEDHTE